MKTAGVCRVQRSAGRPCYFPRGDISFLEYECFWAAWQGCVTPIYYNMHVKQVKFISNYQYVQVISEALSHCLDYQSTRADVI